MGWFWADTAASSAPTACPHPQQTPSNAAVRPPPPGCPMHNATVDALSLHTISAPPAGSISSASPSSSSPSGCPVPHAQRSGQSPPSSPPSSQPSPPSPPSSSPSSQSTLSKLNPLNYMFRELSQERAPQQAVALPTSREESTIPRGDGDGNWEYPSPQQMYNALLRKGYTNTDATAVESMVAVHNFLNEGAWAEIVDWERRFGHGLARGWQISRRGEENAPAVTRALEQVDQAAGADTEAEPRLLRFQGRPGDMTPKAAFVQLLGRLYPSKFATEPPFDRHDWYVARNVNGQEKEVRYVIDFYSGPPEPTGEPVFYLDVRPAMTPTAAVERLMRWGGDVWWRASGGEAREPWGGKA